jgi:hypothetical protein
MVARDAETTETLEPMTLELTGLECTQVFHFRHIYTKFIAFTENFCSYFAPSALEKIE